MYGASTAIYVTQFEPGPAQADWLRPSVARTMEVVTDKLILVNLLVKLGVVASTASILARAGSFRRLFFAEKRSPAQTLGLLTFFLVPLTLGVWIRIVVPNFLAADISFVTVILLGLLIGPGWAMLSGIVLSFSTNRPSSPASIPSTT